jgi:site-specific DNA recombinase
LASVIDRRQERAQRRHEQIEELTRRGNEAELRLKRLYDATEAGIADIQDVSLKDRIAGLKAMRDQAQADIERAKTALDSAGQQAITPVMLARDYGSRVAAIAETISAHSPSVSRLRTRRSASWARRQCC